PRSATSSAVKIAVTKPRSGSTIASGSSSSTASMPSGCHASAASGAVRQRRVPVVGVQRAPSIAWGAATTRIPTIGSSAGTVALRVVERGRRHDRLAAGDLHAVVELPVPLPPEQQRLAEQRRRPGTGDIPVDLARIDRADQRPLPPSPHNPIAY